MPAITGVSATCPQCGAIVQPAMARCRSCGHVLTDESPQMRIAPGQSAESSGGITHPNGPAVVLAAAGELRVDDSLGTFDLDAMLQEAATAGHVQSGAEPDEPAAATDTASEIESLTPRPPTARAAVQGTSPIDASPTEPVVEDQDDRIRTQCGHCGRDVRGPKLLSGKRVKCPTCGESVVLPGGTEHTSSTHSPASGLRLDRSSAATLLKEAVQAALSLPPRADQTPDRPHTLRSRDLRGARKALTRVTESPHRSDAALQIARGWLERLIDSGDPRGAEILLAVLEQLPDALQCVALRGLGHLPSPEALGPLLRVLPEGIEPVVAAAVDGLGELGDPRAAGPLAVLAAGNPDQRRRSLEALTQLGPAALAALNHLAAPERPAAVREVAAESFGRIRDPRAAAPLSRLAKDNEPEVRKAAMNALATLGHRSVVKPLVAGLTDKDEEVRFAAVRGLAENPDQRAAPFLVKQLQDPSRDIRIECIHALGLCGEAEHATVLTAWLECGDTEAELAAVEAVARLGDRTALPRLLEMLEQATGTESDERWACRIIDALRRLKDERAVLPLIEHLCSRSDRVRTRAAEALGSIGDSTALEPLMDRFRQEPSVTAQAAIVKSLGELKDSAALPALRQALEKPDPVRCKAVAALAELGGPDATRLILEQLEHPSGPVRYQAATALGRIGSATAIPHLERLAGDADDMVRRAAVKALRELGDDRTESALSTKYRRPATAPKATAPLTHKPPRPAWDWRSLIPNSVYGLATGSQLAAIGGGLLALLLVAAGAIVWSPFSGGGDRMVPRGFVESLSFSKEGTILLAGRGYGRIEKWNVADESFDETLDFATAQLVAQDANGRYLVAGDGNGSGLYDLSNGQRVVEETGIKSLTVNRAQTRAASEAVDGRVIVWNLESGMIDASLEFDSPTTSAFAVSPDGALCVVGTSDGRLIIIDMQQGSVLHEHALPQSAAVTGLGFNDDTTMLAVGTSGGEIHLWPPASARPQQTLTASFPEAVKAVAFLDANRLLALRGLSIDVWDIAASSARTIAVPLETANAFAVDGSGNRVAVGSSEESAIMVLDVKSGETLAELDLVL